MDAANLVFLDETGINLGMTRLYGRALEGERVVEYIPDVRFERLSVISSMRLDGTLVPFAFEGSLTGEIFLQYVKQFLIPTLGTGDVVIMDNLSSHKAKEAVEAVEAVGAYIIFLPAYSPDLNAIEQMWSKVKAYLRKVKARTMEALYESLKNALNSVCLDDIKGWFRNSGYCV